MTFPEFFQILVAAVGSIGFAILFNIRGRRLLSVAVGGGLCWLLFLLLNCWIENEAGCFFLVAMLVSLYDELMARVLKSPTTVFLLPSLVPLIPGASLYYTMVGAVSKHQVDFLARAVQTVELAGALAIGIIASTLIVRIINWTLALIRLQKNKNSAKK
jgi:uncharacterized membrane protein YjjB (DUF3815 family)